MRFRRRSRTPELTRETSLKSMPVRNPDLKVKREQNGAVTLHVPFRPPRWARFLSKLLRMEDAERRISLDEIGTFVWDMCDGETTVRAMIARFTDKHKLNRKEAEVSMVEYLRTLAKKGLIGIIVPSDTKKKTEK